MLLNAWKWTNPPQPNNDLHFLPFPDIFAWCYRGDKTWESNAGIGGPSLRSVSSCVCSFKNLCKSRIHCSVRNLKKSITMIAFIRRELFLTSLTAIYMGQYHVLAIWRLIITTPSTERNAYHFCFRTASTDRLRAGYLFTVFKSMCWKELWFGWYQIYLWIILDWLKVD